MGELRVITVEPNFLPPGDRADGYAVVLGDCILPGHYLGRYSDPEQADLACRYFADHYGLKAYPLEMWRGRPDLRLIIGGRAGQSEGDPP